MVYRINVYAVVAAPLGDKSPSELSPSDLESKELHVKLVLGKNLRLELYNEEQHQV